MSSTDRYNTKIIGNGQAGIRPEYRRVLLPIINQAGYPQHLQGVIHKAALYLMGLYYQSSWVSTPLSWVDEDAR